MSEDLRCVAVWTAGSGGEWIDGPVEYAPFSQWVAQKFTEGFRVSSLQLVNIGGDLLFPVWHFSGYIVSWSRH